VKRRLAISSAAIALLALIAGCSFFGGDEPNYTNWEPELSPDGRTLVYETPEGEEDLELYTRDVTTGETRQLTFNETADWSPTWSPDGDRIAYASVTGEGDDQNVDVYVIDLATLEIERLTTHGKVDVNPHWAVDGRIYFNSDRSGAWEIYSIDPETKTLTIITDSGG